MLLVAVTLAGYYGGEMTYYHGVGIVNAAAGAAGETSVAGPQPLLPSKPVVALMGFLATIALFGWLGAGQRVAPRYFARWRDAAGRELRSAPSSLWTVQR